VLQCVAVCCNVLQRVAVCCSVLQCVAVCCSVLQCVAVCLYRTSHKEALGILETFRHQLSFALSLENLECLHVDASAPTQSCLCCSVLQCVTVCCCVLLCVAVCCSVLQYGAVCCSLLQCGTLCCSVMQCDFGNENFDARRRQYPH